MVTASPLESPRRTVLVVEDEPMLRAWPWSHGTTGRGAYVWTPQKGLLGFSNHEGVFAGPNGAPEADDIDSTWLAISFRR